MGATRKHLPSMAPKLETSCPASHITVHRRPKLMAPRGNRGYESRSEFPASSREQVSLANRGYRGRRRHSWRTAVLSAALAAPRPEPDGRRGPAAALWPDASDHEPQ